MLDLNGPWFWILYTLAGAGVTVAAESFSLKVSSQLHRDLYAAHPSVRAMMLLVLWAIWPLIVASVMLAAITVAAWWVWDGIVYLCEWVHYGVGLLLDRVRRS
jgi:hypothetical protein